MSKIIIYQIDMNKVKVNKEEVDELVLKFINAKENLDLTNKEKEIKKQEKYNWFVGEFILEQVFNWERNKDIYWDWDLKYNLNNKTIYIDSKILQTDKELVESSTFTNESWKEITYPSWITNRKQPYNKINWVFTQKSIWYCIYLQSSQVLKAKEFCDNHKVDYNDFYFVVNYLSDKNKRLFSIFGEKLNLPNVLKCLRKNENPQNTYWNSEEVDNYIVVDLYKEFEVKNIN